MSFFKEPLHLGTDDRTEPANAEFDQRFDALVEEYFFTGDISLLKEFVSRGGDIDQYRLRETIADLIGTKDEPNRGGAKDAINLAFYMAVESRLRRLERKPKNKDEDMTDRPLQEQLASLKKVGKKAAIEQLSSEWSAKGRGTSYEGGRSRYEKGKKLFKEKYEKV
jgi:hypothetical protein